ncbi:hypothetical protein MTR67_013598 [Solanum verrucosum]|uniref:Uncharacterized protein n=1 Tax=Solanum verrucosum TaxID=315347 RepID=A0AAF0TM82_SOLVR|nr:hypothetical protein MTR67_013598 [Solanum verrucosum]
MASKTSHPSVAHFLSLNLVLFALVSGTNGTDTLKLGVCANILNLVSVIVGSPPTYGIYVNYTCYSYQTF